MPLWACNSEPIDNKDICKFLATRGAKVDHQDEEGKTALFAAIFAGNPALVKSLQGLKGLIRHLRAL